METTNTSDNTNADERRLCRKCQTFYGTSATNFMCSKCFKENQEADQKPVVDAKVQSKPEGTPSGDVEMAVADDTPAPEENKAESRPIQVPFYPFKSFIYFIL